MRKIYFIICIAFFSLLSCTSGFEEPGTPLNGGQKEEVGLLSREDVILFADQYMQALTGKTRSVRKVADVNLVALSRKDGAKTRGGNIGDEVTYLVNYENEEGFVLMSGNSSSCILLAISDEANLNMNDTIENKALAGILESYIGILPPGTVVPRDSITINLDTPPLLPKYVRKWGQNEPFNSEVPLEKNSTRHCAVGCGPLAAAMIMAYCEWPNSYKGYTFDWSAIKNGTADNQIAMLLKFIGDKDAMYTTYGGANGSGTSISKIPDGFAALNYNFGNGFLSYPSSIPGFSQINNRPLNPIEHWTYTRPAYMIGEMDYNGGRVGHAWIVDGRLTIHHDPNAYKGEAPEDDIYLHCVWGHYGKGNGYFLVRKNGIGGDSYKTDPQDGAYPGYTFSPSTYDWTYNLKFNQTIVPNK